MTTVVSVRVDDIRPEYTDLYEWCQDPNNVYIGRANIVLITRDGVKFRYPPASIFANPYLSMTDYKSYLINKLHKGDISLDDLDNLKGKRLGCWCKTKKTPNKECHGDVIIQLIKEISL